MGENIIFTAYFTTKKDPQRRKYWKQNDITLINPLYDSVKRLGLNMIIFQDGASKEFVNKYSTDKIRFERYKLRGEIPLTERFRCYFHYLKKYRYEKILCLDCGDLELFKDPFPLIDDSILIGSEESKIGDSVWIKDKFQKAFGEVSHEDKKVLNCGILGGQYDNLFTLLSEFKQITDTMKRNADMAIFNKLIYDGFKFKTGYPIHTVFNKFETDSGCYIRHK